MAIHTLSGYLGLLILPDNTTANVGGSLYKGRSVAPAEYIAEPEGLHVTLYRAKTIVDLPMEVARKIVGKLNEYLVPTGDRALITMDGVKISPDKRYLFWLVKRDGIFMRRLLTAHAMSLVLSAWAEPDKEAEDNNTRMFGTPDVENDYTPHITLAANTEGFPRFTPLRAMCHGHAKRVVLARMGKWGKIEEILI